MSPERQEPGATAANAIVVERDYQAERQKFLAGLSDPKIREAVERLGPHPYLYDRIFYRLGGWGAAGEVKRKVELLLNVEPLLPGLLFPGEEIRFVTRGFYNSFWEQYFLGWMAQLINQTVFLFTNYRIVMLNVNSKGRPLQMKWHIPYDQIARFKPGGFISSSIVFKLKDGAKLTFSGTRGSDRKALKDFVAGMVQGADAEGFHLPHFQSRDDLCTNCFTIVEPKSYKCKKCGEEFIRPKKPAMLSLALPCLGDFYLGHRLIAGLEIVGYVVLWLVFLGLLAEEGPSAMLVILPLLAVEHGLDALLTLHIAKKGLVSTKKAWQGH